MIRELRVEDALIYLDQVKLEFSDKPHIYNEFLEIMKNFKSQEIDTPGVIIRVKTLFKGYDKLILGFNTFLPEGFKISLDDILLESSSSSSSAAMSDDPQQPFDHTAQLKPLQTMLSTRSKSSPSLSAMKQEPERMMDEEPNVVETKTDNPASSMQQQVVSSDNSAINAQAGETAGGDHHHNGGESESRQPVISQQQHAINYVTAIRNRFSNDPDTYRTFLRILHTYQREQKGINEVLEQVSRLFADHPDLLMEFTYFLPDAVQDKAKQRLNQAVAEAENRKKAKAAGLMPSAVSRKQKVETSSMRLQKQAVPAKRLPKRRFENEWSNQPTSTARHIAPNESSTSEIHSFHTISVERALFEKIKDVLCSLSHDLWLDFLRCLDLFGQGQLGRKDMLKLLSNIFGPNIELFEEFKNTFNSKTAIDASTHSQDLWYSLPLSEIDFSQCRKCTPSYRALPRDYPSPRCSARTEAESKLLNDRWVSIPVGSEESYSFKHMRRNNFEDALFKCEDDHFELDMLIDSTMSTIRIFEPIAREIMIFDKQDVGEHSLDAVQVPDAAVVPVVAMVVTNDEVSSGPPTQVVTGNPSLPGKMSNDYHFDVKKLSIVHLNTIARVYGDHAGDVLDLLRRNPAATIPVILKRLKQKDTEWRKVRQEVCKTWRDAMEKNFSKSLDQRSHYFRQQDKRLVSLRGLIQEIKDIRTEMESDLASILTSMSAMPRDSTGSDVVASLLHDPVHARQLALFQLTRSRMAQHEQYVKNIHWHKTGIGNGVSNKNSMAVDSASSSSDWPTLRERIRLPHDIVAHVGTGLVVLPNLSGLTIDEISSLIGFLPQVHSRIRSKLIMHDVFKIITYAVEQQSLAQMMQHSQASSSSMGLSSADKDKICVLWRDLLRYVFDIPVHVMFQNQSHLLIAASVAGMQPASDQSSGKSHGIQQQRPESLPLSSRKQATGPLDVSKEESYEQRTKVETLFGKGIIEGFNVMTSIYRVRLVSFGGNSVTAYLHPSAIISLDGLTLNDLETIGIVECSSAALRMFEVEHIEGGPAVKNVMMSLPSVIDAKLCKPIPLTGKPPPIAEKAKKKVLEPTKQSGRYRRKKMEADVLVVEEDVEEVEQQPVNAARQLMLLGNQNLYVLLRLLTILAERFQMTKDLADEVMAKKMTSNSTTRHPYSIFMSSVMSLVDGSMDNAKFEDALKKAFCQDVDEASGSLGYDCFFLSTIDKVLQQTVRVLQVVACGPEATICTNLFRFHNFTTSKCRPLHYGSHYTNIIINGVRQIPSSLADQGFEANSQSAYEEAYRFNIVPTSVICKNSVNQGIDMFATFMGGAKDVAEDARVNEGFLKSA